MSADDLRLGRRNHFPDVRRGRVGRRFRWLAWRFLTHKSDLKTVSFAQRFLTEVDANCASVRSRFVGCRSRRCFGNLADRHRAEHN
jgi:hypothetical protein